MIAGEKIFTPHRYDMRSWYLISAIILLCLGLYLFLRHETTMNLIIILFSIFLFYQYFRENRRIKP